VERVGRGGWGGGVVEGGGGEVVEGAVGVPHWPQNFTFNVACFAPHSVQKEAACSRRAGRRRQSRGELE
jgi:hypothetical protein